jgi:hypothetical protein
MNKYEIHKSIARAVLPPDVKADDVLLFMVLLHTHDLYLKAGVTLEDVKRCDDASPLTLPAITRRHAAEVVASLWPAGDKRGEEQYWYSHFVNSTPFEVLSDVPAEGLRRLLELKELLLCDPRVEAVVEA